MSTLTRDDINMSLKQYLVDRVFPKVFKKYDEKMKKYGGYMVIIGGVSVEMCVDTDENARHFLENVFSEDVDIKVVIERNQHVEKIHQLRINMLNKVKLHLDKYIVELNNSLHDTKIKTILDESLLVHKLAKVRAPRVVSLSVVYSSKNDTVMYPLLDTSIFSKEATHHFTTYKTMVNARAIVPYYTKNNINYATCEYMMYDTCRMLIDKANYLKEKRTLFALMKFTKYVLKFMSLYVLRGHMKELPSNLVDIYDKSYNVLKNINMYKLKNGFKKMHTVKYSITHVERTIKSLERILKAKDIQKLVKAARHAAAIYE